MDEVENLEITPTSLNVSCVEYSTIYCTIDVCTRFSWIYFLQKKSDVAKIFSQFHKAIETHIGCSLNAIQTNGGGEFKPLSNYLSQFGIAHRFTCPDTSKKNGIIERKHCHIMEMGLTLTKQASLPKQYWSDALFTAVFLINRLPSS